MHQPLLHRHPDLHLPGFGYSLCNWDATNVPNVGFVARTLDEYYPTTDEPAGGLTNPDQKAAAVQAAIWFFTDGFVLNTVRRAARRRGRDRGPRSNRRGAADRTGPAYPDHHPVVPRAFRPVACWALHRHFQNTPRHRRRCPGRRATVTVTGGSMWSDSAAPPPIPDGASVPSGPQIWPNSAALPPPRCSKATAEATVPPANDHLYDGSTLRAYRRPASYPRPDGYLDHHRPSQRRVPGPGSLVVNKTIAGPAAGSQGPVVIHVDCDDGVFWPRPSSSAARAPAGATSQLP